MSIAVHPYLSGQTHRIGHVERTFEEILSQARRRLLERRENPRLVSRHAEGQRHERLFRPARPQGAAQGRRERPARRPDRRGQGHVRHRGRAHRRRQSRTGSRKPSPRPKHAAAVQKLLAAGATIIGKTICDEFFYSVAGMNAHYGTPANLRAPGRIPGGSSSGSAAAAAAGACDFALGSDTGGSVRMPASFCGLYGIRTTHGRVDTSGAMDMSPSFDTVGWFAATRGRVPPRRRACCSAGTRGRRADQKLLDRRRCLRRSRRAGRRRCCATRSPRWPARCRSRSRSASRPTASTPGATPCASSRPRDLAGLRPLRQREASALRARRRRAHADRLRRSPRPRPTPRAQVHAAAREHIRALIPPGTVVALPSAPCIAPLIDTPADALEAYPRARDAAHLHRRPRRPAAGVDPGRHRRRLPGRAVVHRLGRRRRGAARSRRRGRQILRAGANLAQRMAHS